MKFTIYNRHNTLFLYLWSSVIKPILLYPRIEIHSGNFDIYVLRNIPNVKII